MIEAVVNWFRGFRDPLRGAGAAQQWIATLPESDPMALQKEALELVVGFPGTRKDVSPTQVEALLKIDARIEPILAQLTQQYTTNYQKSTAVESRLWHAVFDLVKAFTAAYQMALKAGYPNADNKRWRAVLPWILVRLAFYKSLDGKFRLFRYGHWIPAQWREFHELYEFARMRGWQREQLVFGAGTFARPGVCVEQEYLKTLLLMRLDSGNFTPDQVEWVARQLEDWSPSLTLVPPPGPPAAFFVDLTGTQGLRRQDRATAGGRVLFLDASPVYARVVERMRWLPEQDDDVPKQGEPPAREQRLLLMRLASLFGPDAIAHAPRATRYATDGEVRVVVGLQALTRAVAEIDRLPDAARTPGVAASYDEVTQMVNPVANPESVARRIEGTMWKIEDRSDTGCRLTVAVARGARAAGRAHRHQGRRQLDARRRAPDAAPPGRRGHRRRRDHRAAPGAGAAAHLGDADGGVARRRRPAVLRDLPAGAPGKPAVDAAQPDRPGRPVPARRHGRARHRQRPLPDPVHADARAPARLGLVAVRCGAQAGGLSRGPSRTAGAGARGRARRRRPPTGVGARPAPAAPRGAQSAAAPQCCAGSIPGARRLAHWDNSVRIPRRQAPDPHPIAAAQRL